MRYDRTTKEILHRKMADTTRVPLYNPAALETLRQRLDQWMNSVVSQSRSKPTGKRSP